MMLHALFSQLNTDTYLLTSTATQAQFLLDAYVDHQMQQHKSGWVNPNIMSLSSWLQKQWHHFLDAGIKVPLMLSAHQQTQLWQQCIAAKSEEGVDISSLVSLAKSAHQAAEKWHFSAEEQTLALSHQAWLTWRAAYLTLCQQKKVCDDVAWFKQVITLLSTLKKNEIERLHLSKTILLYGFYQFNVLETQWIAALKKQGVRVESLPLVALDAAFLTSPTQVPCLDHQDEIKKMVQWAKQAIEKGVKKVTCLVPHLSEIQFSLRRAFASEAVYFHEQDHFANIPLIYAALMILKIPNNTLPLTQWSYLLRSPWVGGYFEEMGARAQAVEKLYEMNEFHFSRRATLVASQACVDWVTRLKQLPSFEKYQTASAWLSFFSEVLEVMGWPGDAALSAYEEAVYQSWQDLLVEFSRLDVVKEKVSFSQALAYLQQLASAWHFQSTENQAAPIQVLSLSQAYGLQFEAVWLWGMQDTTLPMAPKPNAILPLSWQRQHKLPYASHEWTLDYSVALMQHLRCASGQLIASFSQQDELGELHPSALIADFALAVLAQTHTTTKPVFFEYYTDEQGAPFSQNPIQGGSAVLSEQALCAFRGYAKHRLKTTTLPCVQYGLTPREKGIVLHRALELIWRSLQTQQALLALSEVDLTQLIQDKSEQALLQILKYRPQLSRSTLITLEQTRLEKLLWRWLALEKQRDAFTVYAVEQTKEVAFEGLSFTLRVDRVDQVAAQSYYIIDYKTSQPSLQDWSADRPIAPQLPLYALVSDMPVAGLLFAQVRADKMGFKGLAIAPGIPGVTIMKEEAAWQQQLCDWQTALNKLAVEIKAGVAVLNPKEGWKTCLQCDLQALCRVQDE